jgi:two-component system LytT family response regulator
VKPRPLTVVIADDERPARRFLSGLLKTCPGIAIVGEASSGDEAVTVIQRERPQLALLDLQMPELTGLDVVRRLSKDVLPLIAFVTAFDDHAIEAFELNAIDYLLKPVQKERLEATLHRARLRLQAAEPLEQQAAAFASARADYERSSRQKYAERLPLRQRDKVLIVPVRSIASVIADGELLHIHTATNEKYTIAHRLHTLEARLDPRRFIRLSRGTLANIEMIAQINPMPGGMYTATLTNGQELGVSRNQSRALRDTLLKF